MKFNELNTVKKKQPNRVGRGIAAGQGKTAGRGTKGQKSRTGSSAKPGFAGGQNPIMQALPKLPGFKSHRPKSVIINTSDLEQLNLSVIDPEALAAKNIIENPFVKIKLLNKGDKLKTKLTVKLTNASQSAIDNIQQAGGTFEKVAVTQRPSTSKNPKKS
jgi:large subunit ribosomal protein L15